jgi:hypothetical protein
MSFGFGETKIRKQGNEHSLCGLSGEFSTHINVIVVRPQHFFEKYRPVAQKNIKCRQSPFFHIIKYKTNEAVLINNGREY